MSLVSFVLWVFPMEHVQSKLDQRKSPTVSHKKLRAVQAHLGHLFLCLRVFVVVIVFLGVSTDASVFKLGASVDAT